MTAAATNEDIARIDRMVMETHKLVAEQSKLMAEERKLLDEERKLLAEGDKLRRDRTLAPAAIILGAVGGAAGLIVAITSLLKSMGVL